MSRRHSPAKRQIVADGTAGIQSLTKRMLVSLEDMGENETLVEYALRRDQVVSDSVAEILQLLSGVDCFDVIDLMRQREVMAARLGFQEVRSEASAASIEIVTLILLAQGVRCVGGVDVPDDRAQRSVNDLHDLTSRILRVGNFAILEKAERTGDEILKLAGQYQGAVTNIRNKQYAGIHDLLNSELFSAEENDSSSSIEKGLGFSFEEFVAVRESLDDTYLDKFFGTMDELEQIASSWAADKNVPQDAPTVERGRLAVYDLHVKPGRRASFTAREISERCSVSISRVEAILTLFSVAFEGADPIQAVLAFLDGNNPFAGAGLVHDGDGNYIQLSVPIGTDHLRQTVESALKGTVEWENYNRRRKDVSEHLAVRHLEKVLETTAAFTDLHYFAPKKGALEADLSADATNITSIGQDSEADALFLIDDVAICVEVKATSLSDGAKRGIEDFIKRDLQKTIGKATEQAHRLENLILQNQGLWLADRTWLDLSQIREVRSIAVCLDDLGPLGTGLDALVRGGLLHEDKFPWIVSVHDLMTISEVLDRAPEFLLYLRRRTDPATSRRFTAIDELDLFMLFMNGGLYLAPDPERVYADFPKTVPPSRAAIRAYADQARTIRVDTHTDPLDEWMENHNDPDSRVTKPAFRSAEKLLAIVDFLRDGRKPGWLRFGADLLNLSMETQRNIASNIRTTRSKTRRDHNIHWMMMSFAGAWGFPSLFVCARPDGFSSTDAKSRLRDYLTLKKHQIQSDRALGLSITHDGQITTVIYDNSAPSMNAELDEIGERVGLVPPGRMPNAIPPSAKRGTKRLAKKNRR